MQHEFIQGLRASGLLHAISQREPCFIKHSSLPPILSIDQVVGIACKLLQTEPHRVSVYDDGKLEYVGTPTSAKDATPDNINLLRTGATLVLDYIHNDVPLLWTLCWELGQIFGTTVQVNAYLGDTGSSGLGLHQDSTDGLIWHQGEDEAKIWEVRSSDNQQLIIQPTMKVSSLLYIREADYHGAETQKGKQSLHLTFAFKRKKF